MSTVAERVAAGAAYLDETEPGWADRVDVDRLDIQSCLRCVLGQLYGQYGESPLVKVFNELEPLTEEWNEHADYVDALGFNATDGTTEKAMTEEWRRLIEARRERARAES